MDDNDINDELIESGKEELEAGDLHRTVHLSGLYQNWFLDYASYVILERAVPEIMDGLKPVQRRIMHAMKDLDDGRYNKVANIIGHTMKYHPHGDASIGDALVQLGQKEFLIDTQGNWGNLFTGDSAAAPRYIEARLSKFALEVLFNPKTTKWKSSYDGRNKEPIALPAKFPLLLAQGVEGIAVGLASKILPHNFNELIDASIAILKDKEFEIYPDFPTGGLVDVSKYNNGLRGGKVRVRAKISQLDKKTLAITEIPYGTTTPSLIESIITANDRGKIKIKKIDDNTAEKVEILIHLASNVSPDTTIDALYAFTNCEVSISPNACIIVDSKPNFMNVKDVLKVSANNTVDLLRLELTIRQNELLEQLHFASLEKIFIEKRIYRNIEECKTWNAVIKTIDAGLEPYKPKFYREVTEEDIIRLTEIKIKRISKYTSFKANQLIKNIKTEIEEVKNHLSHLIDYSINYFRQIKKKYGEPFARKTEIRNFDTIEATMVAAANQKLFFNKDEGFAGTSLKKDEYVCECSDIDDMVIFRADGTFLVTKVSDKVFVGENVIHIDIFKRNDDRTIYNMIYRDGKRGNVYVKRFAVKGITRDKEYNLTKGTDGSRILYFTANPNGEAEVVKIFLRPRPKLKKLTFEYDFGDLAIKGRSSMGNILSRKPVRKVVKKEEGVSTLGAIDIWYDDTVRRLNTDGRGVLVGAFKGDDKIIVLTQSGHFVLYGYELSTHFDEDMILIRKYDHDDIYNVVYMEGESQTPYLKRFTIEPGTKKVSFIGEHTKAELLFFSLDMLPRIEIQFEESPRRKAYREIIEMNEFIAIKSFKAKGKRITASPFRSIKLIDPLPFEEDDDEREVKEEKIKERNEEKSSVSSEILVEKKKTVEGEVKGEKREAKEGKKKESSVRNEILVEKKEAVEGKVKGERRETKEEKKKNEKRETKGKTKEGKKKERSVRNEILVEKKEAENKNDKKSSGRSKTLVEKKELKKPEKNNPEDGDLEDDPDNPQMKLDL